MLISQLFSSPAPPLYGVSKQKFFSEQRVDTSRISRLSTFASGGSPIWRRRFSDDQVLNPVEIVPYKRSLQEVEVRPYPTDSDKPGYRLKPERVRRVHTKEDWKYSQLWIVCRTRGLNQSGR